MPELSTALQECLEAVRTGRELDAILQRYPAQRDELVALLQLSSDVRQLHVAAPDPAFRMRARSALLAAGQRRRDRPGWALVRLMNRLLPARPVRIAAAIALTAALLAGGVIAAAAQSLPVEPLYRLKIAMEELQLAVTLDPAENARLRLELADRRLSEAERLSSLGRANEALDLVGRVDAAVAEVNERIATARLESQKAEALTRDLMLRQQGADRRMDTVAGNLSARGNTDGAAAVRQEQSQVNQSLEATRKALLGQGQGDHGRGPLPQKPTP